MMPGRLATGVLTPVIIAPLQLCRWPIFLHSLVLP
jgi:hypothetical protein